MVPIPPPAEQPKPFAAREAESGPRVPARVRQERVLAAVRRSGFVSVSHIASDLGVSEMTIRRDLTELEREGHLVRSHGGAVAAEGSQPIDREEPAFDARLRRNRHAKEAIAEAALGLIGEAHTVALDVGTTTYHLAARLGSRPGLKTFTNSLRIAALLGGAKQEVYVPAGSVRGDELSICGPAAIAHFGGLWFDIVFLGVSSLNETGFFDYSIEDAEMKRVYMRQSARRIVLCDAQKFDRISLVRVAPLADVHMLITNAPPPPALARALEAASVAVMIADEAGLRQAT